MGGDPPQSPKTEKLKWSRPIFGFLTSTLDRLPSSIYNLNFSSKMAKTLFPKLCSTPFQTKRAARAHPSSFVECGDQLQRSDKRCRPGGGGGGGELSYERGGMLVVNFDVKETNLGMAQTFLTP